MPKTIILYFSRTGTTKVLAEKIAQASGAVLEELKDSKDWSGPLGYLRAGKAAMKKELIEISPLQNDVSTYDLVLVGTPVWVGTMAPAVRTFLENNKSNIKKAALFTTQGSSKRQRVFDDARAILGDKLAGELFLSTKAVRAGGFENEMKIF